MDNFNNRNSFYNKLTAPSTLLVLLIYLLSITLIPIANCIINTRVNVYVSTAEQYNTFKALATKINNAAFNTINTATYINNGQMLLRQIDNTNLQSYIFDAKGSVLKLNNSNGSNAQNYSYDAYGKFINVAVLQKVQQCRALISNDNLNIPNSFQYNGERYDNNTALQYLRARFYNPESKRFVNQDTYDLLNRFGYVDSNPVMGTDPTGHDVATNWIKDAWKSVINGVSNIWNSGTGEKVGLIASGISIAALVVGGKYAYSHFFKKPIKNILGKGATIIESATLNMPPKLSTLKRLQEDWERTGRTYTVELSSEAVDDLAGDDSQVAGCLKDKATPDEEAKEDRKRILIEKKAETNKLLYLFHQSVTAESLDQLVAEFKKNKGKLNGHTVCALNRDIKISIIQLADRTFACKVIMHMSYLKGSSEPVNIPELFMKYLIILDAKNDTLRTYYNPRQLSEVKRNVERYIRNHPLE